MDPGLDSLLSVAAWTFQCAPAEPEDLLGHLRTAAEFLALLDTVPRGAALLFHGERMGVEARLIADGISVGREGGCDLRFDELSEMSRFHFEIVRIGGQYLLRDRQSLNGTYIRGWTFRIQTHELRDGDIIDAGGVTFVFIRPWEVTSA